MSSSSGHSERDDDAPVVAQHSSLHGNVALAQICHFCTTFRVPLKLSAFTRTELQDALVEAPNSYGRHVDLLAELHYKLAREQLGVKMDKMLQDWERAVARKLAENWQLAFPANPMEKTSYADLTVEQRIDILNALCHWKAESSMEVRNHIANIQKENDSNAFDALRGSEIGTDDQGVSYWYFDDGCWVYAEDKPRWQVEKREPVYVVEFANAKRIQLSINFDVDNTIQQRITANGESDNQANAVKFLLKEDQIEPERPASDHTHLPIIKEEEDDTANNASLVSRASKEADNGDVAKKESPVSDMVKEESGETIKKISPVGDEAEKVSHSKIVELKARSVMDISMICASSPSSDDGKIKVESRENLLGKSVVVVSAVHNSADDSVAATVGKLMKHEPLDNADENPNATTVPESKVDTTTNGGMQPNKDEKESEDLQARHMAVLGSKKKFIIDDDTTDSSSDSEGGEKKKSKAKQQSDLITSPVKKKRKASMDTETAQKDAVKKLKTEKEVEAKETQSSKTAGDHEQEDEKKTTSELVAPSTIQKEEGSQSPVVENFDVICECCKKDYDMRYLDPPLLERPSGEWRCFECLVNDARGWPRRRQSSSKSPTAKTEESEEKKSSSKKRSSSSRSKSSKGSNSKSSSSKSGSHSNKRRKSSSSNNHSSSKKSSSKKHKKKSSSSSHHHSSHHHHRRRYHHEFSKLLGAFQARRKDRLAMENVRISGEDWHSDMLEGPTSWRVVCSTLDDLRNLTQMLSGGSLEQERLRGRLISILKTQERIEEDRRKQQELAWQVLPRRQSSRIAIGKIKSQTSKDSDVEEYESDDEHNEGRRTRSRASSLNGTVGYDSKQQLALERASRARRRHRQMESDEDAGSNDDDEHPQIASVVGDWINWSILTGNKRSLSTLCLTIVDRLLKEEIADLFARPVDPELDGCPDYFSVIKYPIDLGTIRSRLQNKFYQTWEQFKMDVEHVWENCRTFNDPDTVVVQYANSLDEMFRYMSKIAERKNVRKMKDKISDNEGSSNGGDGSSSEESRPESRSSVNKAWTESSSSSASSGSSDDDNDSSDSSNASDNDMTRQTRWSTRSRPTTRDQNSKLTTISNRAIETTRPRAAKKRAPTWKSDANSDSSSSDTKPASRRPIRRNQKAESPTANGSQTKQFPTQPPPPPPLHTSSSPTEPQVSQRTSRSVNRPTRLRISDSSSSDDSEDDKVSSSDSDDSASSEDVDSDNETVRPPEPSRNVSNTDSQSTNSNSAPVGAAILEAVEPPKSPPPPPPPLPASTSKAAVTPKTKIRSAANSSSRKASPHARSGRKVEEEGNRAYVNSPTLLNSYLSPSSSSSSYFSSSAESDDDSSNDGKSDSE